MAKFGIGQPVLRTEDKRFITGTGRYTDDINLDGQVYVSFVRSPYAHAEITAIDITDARAADGVLGVLTGQDLLDGGVGDLPCNAPIPNRDNSSMVMTSHPALARGRVRHVGDPVVAVIAETPLQAKDAAELVMIDYAELPANADTARALAPDAPQIWDQVPRNLACDWEIGNEAAVDAAFADADRVVEVDLINQRVVVNSMEPRMAIGAIDDQGRYTLYTSSQGVHSLRGLIAERVFKVEPSQVHVITPDVGGGFGMKIFLYAEYVVALYAARRFGRPVKWTSERTEAFMSDSQGRDHVTKAKVALDADGRFLALKVHTIANLGAYLSTFGPFIPTAAGTQMLAGVYATPAIYAHVEAVYTNTVPVDAYRGAGRPEANYVMERVVNAVAIELGLSQDEIRRRNFIKPDQMPFKSALGHTYDSGDFEATMEKAMAMADYAGGEARKAQARARGKLYGLGMAYYIEACAGGNPETSRIEFDQDGARVRLLIGTQNNGQGHETAYAQIIAENLGIPFENVQVVQGDSDLIATGGGTGGSRSVPVGGAATEAAAHAVIEKGKRIAGEMLEAAAGDIEFDDGTFAIAGTDRAVGIMQVAAEARKGTGLADDEDHSLDASGTFQPPSATFPNGCHICEVEIDEDTGRVRIEKYSIVDDFGQVINPQMLLGQVHGGTVQGLGQALLENTIYDTESGQLTTGSFMDYCMPRADDTPFIAFDMNNVPCTTNPLGLKGAGEAGAIGAPPAIINAVIDALRPFGITSIDMPATPERVWRAIQNAKVAHPQAAE